MKWISVKERLPKYSIDILITDGEEIEIGCLDIVGWIKDLESVVTHWMPLPHPPKNND